MTPFVRFQKNFLELFKICTGINKLYVIKQNECVKSMMSNIKINVPPIATVIITIGLKRK